METSFCRGTFARPMKSWDQKGCKSKRPVERQGGARSQAPTASRDPQRAARSPPAMARAAPLLAMLATLLTAAAAGGDAPPGKIGAGRMRWGARAGRGFAADPGQGRAAPERSWVQECLGAGGRGRSVHRGVADREGGVTRGEGHLGRRRPGQE